MRMGWLPVSCALLVSTLALVALTAAPVAAADGDSAPASVGVRIVDVPQGLSNDPRAGLYIVDHVAPGSRIDRRIEVSTTAGSVMPVELYAAAATIEDGAFTGAADRTPNDLSTWISIAPTSVDLPAGGTATATVEIRVPVDAAPGEHYGVVWVEARSPAGTDGGVTQVSRVGIRVYLSVGPGGPPAANFEIDALTAERSPAGAPAVVATVRNTGGRALDLSGELTLLDGPGGLAAGPFPAQLGVTLGIGETESVVIELDARLPAGPWDAQLTLASGLVERTVHGDLTFPDSGQAPPVEAEPLAPAWVMPALVALVALLLLCVAGLIWVLAGRRRRT